MKTEKKQITRVAYNRELSAQLEKEGSLNRKEENLRPLYPKVWQEAFSLGQNVRFTRTPEVEIMRRRIESDPYLSQKIEKKICIQEFKELSNENISTTDFVSLCEKQNIMSDTHTEISCSKMQDKDLCAGQEPALPTFFISDTAFFEYMALSGGDLLDEADAHAPHTILEDNSKIFHSMQPDLPSEAITLPRNLTEKACLHPLETRFPTSQRVDLSEKTDLKKDVEKNGRNQALEEFINCSQEDQKVEHSNNLHLSVHYKIEQNFSYGAFLAQKGKIKEDIKEEVLKNKNSIGLQYPSLDLSRLESFENKDSAEIIEPNTQAEKDIVQVKEKIESVSESSTKEKSFDCTQTKNKEDDKIIKLSSALLHNRKSNILSSNSGCEDRLGISKALEDCFDEHTCYHKPAFDLLQLPAEQTDHHIPAENLERSAGLLESVLEDFGIKGEIIHVRPGPVVTLYEFEPAAGVKSSRVIGLTDDIARSMSAISARVAVIPGRNVIGIELPNQTRETVYLREVLQSQNFQDSHYKLALALGKNIGGETEIAELAKMPHLLVAGTTGSGKSVAINAMILSLLYRMTPQECRLIMVDPKMLELSIYDGIPHLLTPVVTDPKKAVTALKWAVREMEDRYRKMAKLGVRNIDGFNARILQAIEKGETLNCTVQAGFDKETGELLYQEETIDLVKLPYIVIIVDEMADLMMVAGKEIEGAIQRLAQMARAAGIHLIMATQRPSVDVITGTIKANFPTRISFQVTSKIDSRTILGEQGAETLLGQGDMLHMAGGGRISRIHGPFVSDAEIEKVVSYLKTQGTPEYLAHVTDNSDEEELINEADSVAEIVAAGNTGDDFEELYLQAVKIVVRDKKCSTSYIQRRLSIGYNKAASLVERMEEEGIVGAANHVGKREILIHNQS